MAAAPSQPAVEFQLIGSAPFDLPNQIIYCIVKSKPRTDDPVIIQHQLGQIAYDLIDLPSEISTMFAPGDYGTASSCTKVDFYPVRDTIVAVLDIIHPDSPSSVSVAIRLHIDTGQWLLMGPTDNQKKWHHINSTFLISRYVGSTFISPNRMTIDIDTWETNELQQGPMMNTCELVREDIYCHLGIGHNPGQASTLFKRITDNKPLGEVDLFFEQAFALPHDCLKIGHWEHAAELAHSDIKSSSLVKTSDKAEVCQPPQYCAITGASNKFGSAKPDQRLVQEADPLRPVVVFCRLPDPTPVRSISVSPGLVNAIVGDYIIISKRDNVLIVSAITGQTLQTFPHCDFRRVINYDYIHVRYCHPENKDLKKALARRRQDIICLSEQRVVCSFYLGNDLPITWLPWTRQMANTQLQRLVDLRLPLARPLWQVVLDYLAITPVSGWRLPKG